MTERNCLRLSKETGASVRTVRRWLAEPSGVSRPVAYALRAAARALRIRVKR